METGGKRHSPVTSSGPQLEKRRQLAAVLKLLMLMGVFLLSLPFIANLRSTFTTPHQPDNSWVFEVSLGDLLPGQMRTYNWPAGELAVYRRTVEDIQALQTAPAEPLVDVDSRMSDQPGDFSNSWRSYDEAYFVFIPVENLRGCLIRLQQQTEAGIFSETCMGARYDAAGRRYQQSGREGQNNLAVPLHQIANGQLKVAPWRPRIN